MRTTDLRRYTFCLWHWWASVADRLWDLHFAPYSSFLVGGVCLPLCVVVAAIVAVVMHHCWHATAVVVVTVATVAAIASAAAAAAAAV